MDLELALQHRAEVEAFRRKHRTGLVTLVFTDIVGSTQLKQALGDCEGVALIQQPHAMVRVTRMRNVRADFEGVEALHLTRE